MRRDGYQCTSGALPVADDRRFGRLERADVVGLCLASAGGPATRAKLDRQLKPLLSSTEVRAALDVLQGKGLVRNAATNPSLTSKGAEHWSSRLGSDRKQPWKVILSERLAAVVLGLSPDDRTERKRVSESRALTAVIIAVGYGFASSLKSVPEVRSELVWRVLRSRLVDVVGNGPFPVEPDLDRHSRSILLGLAGLKSGSVQQAMAMLAARCVGLEKADAGELRMALVRHALRPRPEQLPSTGFAQNVLAVASEISTPPFTGRVAIAQVYDAYGKRYADAGSLVDFKRRLVDAARQREVSLQKVDMGELMAKELRERSQTHWDSDVVHLLVVDWS